MLVQCFCHQFYSEHFRVIAKFNYENRNLFGHPDNAAMLPIISQQERQWERERDRSLVLM